MDFPRARSVRTTHLAGGKPRGLQCIMDTNKLFHTTDTSWIHGVRILASLTLYRNYSDGAELTHIPHREQMLGCHFGLE